VIRLGGTVLSLFAALAVLLTLPVSAAAKSMPITGKLSKRGYTVIALDAQGQATSVVAKKGKFKLRPRANKVTLQLRAPNGTYAGPIVVQGGGSGKAKKSKKGKKSKRVIVGVKAGASLGKIKVKPGKGFSLAEGVAKKSLDTKRTATAKKGVPIGAGNFGRVAVAKLNGPTSDIDLDGVPAPLDIDDDGDLVLDDVDPNPTVPGVARAAQAPGSGNFFAANFTQLFELGNFGVAQPFNAPHTQPVNASAPNLSDAQIEAALRDAGKVAAGVGFDSAELDCGGLSYCSAGGTGRYSNQRSPDPSFETYPNAPPFPACCDPDGDGFGSLDVMPGGGSTIFLLHGANSDQIRAGDQLLMKGPVHGSGEQAEATTTLATTFATPPALASYTDGLNDQGQGETHPVTYPITPGSALPVRDGPDADSDVEVKLTFWRPQRRAIPADPAGSKWMDVGGLMHFVGAPGGDLSCPTSTFSDWDPILEPSQQPAGAPGNPIIPVFLDKYTDHPADRNVTFSYTLNLTQCAVAQGSGFDPGAPFGLRVNAFPVPTETMGPPGNGTSSGYLFRNQP
jgi:hypothetical protein